MKVGGSFEKPNIMIVNSYRYTEIYESTKRQYEIQAVTEANGLNAIDWNKRLRYEWMRLVGTKDWDKKNEMQWSYEGKRGSGIEQKRSHEQSWQASTKHQLWKLNASTLTPGPKQQLWTLLVICHHHVVDSSCTTALEAMPSSLGGGCLAWAGVERGTCWTGAGGREKEPTTRLPHKVSESQKLNIHQG